MDRTPFPDLEQIEIQPDGIKKNLLSALNPNKATGPDNISGRFLKELHEELTPALVTNHNDSPIAQIEMYQ